MNADPTTVLHADDAWESLRSSTIGCLAVIVSEAEYIHPEIFSINYAVKHSSLVFRSGEGTKIDAIHDHPQVAFEVDGFSPEAGEAWSVDVKGAAKPISRRGSVFSCSHRALLRRW